MSSRSRFFAITPAVALVAAGVASTAPAQAATTYVTATTAGTKAVGATTYMWGNTDAAPGSSICSQVALGGGWSTSQCGRVSNDGSYALPLTYGSSTPGTYTFHAVTQGVTSRSVTLTRVGSPTTPTPPPSGLVYQGGVLGNAYTMYTGYNGVKVYLAQKALGMHPGPMDSTLGPLTARNLRAFQARHGIPASGNIDQTTWNALNTGYPFTIDSWAKTSDVLDDAPRDVKVAAQLSFAKAQLGKPYIWGGTGPMGFDCSGLTLQAVRAGGMKPQGVNNLIDIVPTSALANALWSDGEFQKGSLSRLQLGDLIYYGGSNGVAHHVAMYVGNNTVINAIGSSVQYSSLSSNAGWSRKLGVNRAFPL